jgi:hypothetical protein
MTPVVVLPHADPSIRLAVHGRPVLDLHQDAVARLTGPERRAALLAERPDDPLLRAANLVLSTSDIDQPAGLHAAGVLLLLGDPHDEWSVRLRLDDLELVHGSTESSADAVRAAEGLPFGPEIDVACEAVRDGGVLWLDRDQQLPAMIAMVRRLARAVDVAGPFADRHWLGLRRLLPPESCLVPLRAHWETADGVVWLNRIGSVWADEVRLDEETTGGCRAAILQVATADDTHVRTADGSWWPWPEFGSHVERLRADGTEVLVEFWCLAPGETAVSCVRTAEQLVGAGLPWRIVGARPFHLQPADADQWGANLVRSTEDLARSAAYERPEPNDTWPDVVTALRRAGRLAPHRTACGYLESGRTSSGLAPGVVPLEDVLVDLGTARVLRIDPRFARMLARGSEVPERARRPLAQAGVLR